MTKSYSVDANAHVTKYSALKSEQSCNLLKASRCFLMALNEHLGAIVTF